jgi:hypothetical protein
LIFIGSGRKKSLLSGEELGILIPIRFLLFLSVFIGCWMSLFLIPVYIVFLPLMFKGFILFCLGVVFIMYSQIIKVYFFRERKASSKLSVYISSMWFLPYLTRFLFFPALKLGVILTKLLDQGWTEFIGGRGAVNVINQGSVSLFLLNYVNIKFYLLRFFLIIFIFYIFVQ